jgi:hypothetical protein
MLAGIFIDKTICAAGCDSGSENALAFRAGPLSGLFALFEGFHGTSC